MDHYKHKIRVYCYKLPLDINYPYLAICEIALTCEHNYTHTCKDYNTRINNMIINKIYRVYNTRCGRLYTTYSHSYKALCYSDMPCPLCIEPYKVNYNYLKYSKLCYKPYILCAKDYS
jgi:hypothetical protein